jgi:hypothetical protein
MRIRVCLAVAIATVLASAAPAQAELKSIWGPSTLLDGRSAFPIYRDLGVDVLQDQLVWSRVATRRPAHPRNPNDPAYVWPATIDTAYAQGARYGIRLALMVRGTPGWANGGRSEAWAPTHVRDYGNFMIAAARRYRNVKHWMIWGEPVRAAQFQPFKRFSRKGPIRYAQLLDKAYGALKSVRRSNIVIGGMTVTYADMWARDWIRWMRLPNGRLPRLDWFGHNPFSGRRPKLSNPTYRASVRDMSDVDTLVRQVRRHWRPRHIRPRLWLSEFCVPSDRASYAFSFHVSRPTQARWLGDAFRISHNHGFIAGIGWFNLQDGEGPNGVTCGLLDTNGRRKAAYAAYKRAR